MNEDPGRRHSCSIPLQTERLLLRRFDTLDTDRLIVIAGDQRSTTEYVAWAVKRWRPGALVFRDHVVRHGGLADASSEDPDVLGMRRFLERLGKESRVVSTAIQTVGGKSYDGFALALVIR